MASGAEHVFRWVREQAFAAMALLMVLGGAAGYFAAGKFTPMVHDWATKIDKNRKDKIAQLTSGPISEGRTEGSGLL